MREKAALILALFLLASFPAEASEGRHAEWVSDPELPNVQWNASVDIGYISTTPLVKEGLVIVKGGGDSMTGEGAGLVAFRADTGIEVWRTIHSASDMGFETAPLLYVSSSIDSGNCTPPVDLVVTGWTSGHLTAYDFKTGIELWNQSTEAPMWGISGGGFSLSGGKIVWPTETGVVEVCGANGTKLQQYHDSNLRTYRANLGIWFDWESDENGSITTSMGWLQGTETAHLLRYGDDSLLIEDIDIVTLANLTGTWRIRSTPISVMGQGVLVHLHSDSETRLVRVNWNETGLPVLLDSIPMGPGTATTPAGLGYISAIAGMNDAIHYGIINETLFEAIRWNATNVVGEIGFIQWGEVSAICLPQNTADGSWYIAIDANHSVEWIPDVASYVTSGCGSDGLVHAVANDASWLEVRYDPIDWNLIHNMADQTLETEAEQEPQESNNSDETVSSSDSEKSTPGIIWLPFIGAGIFAIVAQICQGEDIRRQVRVGALIMVMLGLIMAAAVYNQQIANEPETDSSQRLRAAILVPEVDDTLAENEVLVAFHFPESYAPDGCTIGEVFSLENNQSWSIDSNSVHSDCIVVAAIQIESGDTVEMVTMTALDQYQYTYEIEQQILGLFLQDIGDATGGADGRWWSYDLNGGYGTIGMTDQVIQPGDNIDWHFDQGQF